MAEARTDPPGTISTGREDGSVELILPDSWFTNFADAFRDWITLHDATGAFLQSSPAGERLTGWAATELSGRNSLDFHHPDDLAAIRDHLQGSLSPSALPPIAYRFRRKDGSYLWLETVTRILRSVDENETRILAVTRDINDRKLAEERLRDSEEKFRSIVEASPLGMHFYRLEGSDRLVFEGGNPAADRILGIRHADLAGKTILEAFPSLTETEVPKRYVEVIRSGEVWQREEFAYADDRIVGAFEIFAFRTSPSTMAVKFAEISKRKQMELDLASEKERLAVTLRSIGDGVIATDLQQRVILLNKIAEQMTGWSNEEAQGRPIAEVFNIVSGLTRKPRENPVEKVIASGQIAGLASHTTLIARNGAEYSIADSASPIRDRKSHIIGVVLVFRDVTDRLKIEEELTRAQKLESLAVLAGGIAHDFNNLLTGILGNISLARADVLSPAEMAESLAESERACFRAQKLTQQLLTFSKGGAPVKKSVALGAVVRETAQFSARGSSVACSFDLPSNLVADVDEGQVSQVVHNIVLNATQAMTNGGTIHIRGGRQEVLPNNPWGLAPGPYVSLTLSDDGPGIPEEYLPRVFDPFFTTKAKGQGLGLAICHSVIAKHEGHISISSRVGAGTTFTILLPARSESARADSLPSPEARGTFRERILVMDDEEQVRGLAVRMLRILGCDVATASDGEDAIEQYRIARADGSPFAAVILDLTVPGGMGGKEVVSRLKQIDPAVRAIVSSGYSSDPIVGDYTKYGFRGVLTKPYGIESLVTALTSVLRG